MPRFTGWLLLLGGVGAVCLAFLGIVGMNFAAAGDGLIFAFLFLGFVGLALIYGGYRVLARGPASAVATQDPAGAYQANVLETRQWDGKNYEVQYLPPIKGKNGRPSSLTVRVPVGTPATIHLNRENWFDRLCKGIGIAREHQTGDADFDEVLYVRSPSHAYPEAYLQDDKKRAAVLAIVRHGFPEVRLTGENAEAGWVGFNPLTDDRPDLTDDAARGLFVLATNLPADNGDFAPPSPDWHKIWLVLLWVFAVAYACLAAFMFIYPPIRTSELVLAGLGAGFVAYLAFGWLAALLLHGRSTSHDRWALLMGIGVFLIFPGSGGAVAALNALADSGPLEVHTVTVVNKHISVGRRNAKTYFVVVHGWKGSKATVQFRVNSEEHIRIVPNRSQLELTTGPGWFGIEWLKAKRVLP